MDELLGRHVDLKKVRKIGEGEPPAIVSVQLCAWSSGLLSCLAAWRPGMHVMLQVQVSLTLDAMCQQCHGTVLQWIQQCPAVPMVPGGRQNCRAAALAAPQAPLARPSRLAVWCSS